MQIRNNAILEAEAELKQAEDNCRAIIKDVQSRCSHQDVGETTGYIHDFKNGRVCFACGAFRIAPTFPATSPLGNSLVYKLTYDQFTKLKRGV